MHSVLIFAPLPLGPLAQAIRSALLASGYSVACPDLDSPMQEALDALQCAFLDRPPDVVIADLSSSPDCLPLHRLGRLLRELCDEDAPLPPRLALLCPAALVRPDWQAAADDFLLPPYAPEEALARVRLLLFRRQQIGSGDTLKFAGITIDLIGGQTRDSAGNTLPLRPREFELLRFLVTHRGKFFSRARLLDMVWGVEFEGTERTVDIHIRRLRAKLPPQFAVLIETRRGIGYGFRTPK